MDAMGLLEKERDGESEKGLPSSGLWPFLVIATSFLSGDRPAFPPSSSPY